MAASSTLADLSDDGRAGTDGVGHPAYGQGNDDDDRGAAEQQGLVVKGIQEGDAQHGSGMMYGNMVTVSRMPVRKDFS